MREWLETLAKYYPMVMCVTALVIFEAESIPYSDLFVSVLTASLGVAGVSAYGTVRRVKNARNHQADTD